MNRKRVYQIAGAVAVLLAFTGRAAAQQPLLCQVKITNNIEGAVITNITAQFYFEGGGQYICDKDVEIRTGETRYCDSNTNSRCTKRASVVILVQYGGQSIPLTYQSEDAGAGNCWILIPLELNPRSIIKHKEFEKLKSGAERAAATFLLKTIDPKTELPVVKEWKYVEDTDQFKKMMRAEAEKAGAGADKKH